MSKNLKVLVLAGGRSAEREVSLNSARAVAEALMRLGYDVRAIDTAGGIPLIGPDRKFLLQPDTSSSSKLALKMSDSLVLAESLASENYRDTDVVFIALHGGAGEDGTIQAILDLAGVKYTGSGMLASALAMNKAMTKRIISGEGIPTPPWFLVPQDRMRLKEKIAAEISEKFPLPLIIKPNDGGSTVGLTLVKKYEDIPGALETVFKYSREALVEGYIKGREITCAVLGGEALPLVEIIPTNELYDYQCKYTKGKSRYVCPAEVPADIVQTVQNYSAKAYHILGCRGLVRADYILDDRNQPYFLEVNTIPGMTELSLAPMAARQAGMDFDRLIARICELAREKTADVPAER